jgi:phosphohistidine phosphatase SixA
VASSFVIVALLAIASASLQAQQASLQAQQPNGSRGIDAARGGGVVIACRHAMTDAFDENETTLRYDDPATQRRLSARGERQADAMGRAFRALRINVTDVIASPMQRSRRHAEIAFGAPALDSSWHTRGSDYSGPKRERRLEQLSHPASQGNRVIVSHYGTMRNVLPGIRDNFQEGDCIVVRPLGDGKHETIEVVPWRAWLRAAHLDDSIPQS